MNPTCTCGEYKIRTGDGSVNIPPFTIDGITHREDGPCGYLLALSELRAMEKVLARQ